MTEFATYYKPIHEIPKEVRDLKRYLNGGDLTSEECDLQIFLACVARNISCSRLHVRTWTAARRRRAIYDLLVEPGEYFEASDLWGDVWFISHCVQGLQWIEKEATLRFDIFLTHGKSRPASKGGDPNAD